MTERRAVLITGCSSGIGASSARRSIASGFHVYAGVRTEADATRVAAELGADATPLIIDVADIATIAAARVAIERAGRGLFGVVNNAGIAVTLPLETFALGDIRRQFDINVIGLIAVTQAFLPLLRRSRGRVINIGSVSGRFAAPCTAPYAASKFAVEAISDALRVELARFGIAVVVLEPGAIATPIWEKSLRAAEVRSARYDSAMREAYGPLETGIAAITTGITRYAIPVERVARVIERALVARRPRARYVIGRDARVQLALNVLPSRWRDRLIGYALERAAQPRKKVTP